MGQSRVHVDYSFLVMVYVQEGVMVARPVMQRYKDFAAVENLP